MSDKLEAHLKLKTAAEPNSLMVLHSQWEFDKQLIPKALQNIGSLFPHYSRHDQSHSNQILINIERLLGDDRIVLLGATDTWLLLEAAYLHDIGMVVPHQDLIDAIKDPKFKEFSQGIENTHHHYLQAFAKNFNANLNANRNLNNDELPELFRLPYSPIENFEYFRLFMSEWFRQKHQQRAEHVTNNPSAIGLTSPRTELIPKRLYRWLGVICAMHGQDFQTMLKTLPFKEVGLGNDDCHPRLIACLLRLGDLLDVDDNRFCPVMQTIAGKNRPKNSLAHEHKHGSIRHFRLDPECIEIESVCDDLDGYLEQWRWMDWLRDEVKQQMAHWQQIAPNRQLGLLPTIGSIKVELAGRKLFNEGERPQFRPDSKKVMQLLQGDNLYTKTDTFRELLQNAVDTTLIRLWHSNKDELEKIDKDKDNKHKGDFSNPESIFQKKFPIKININLIINNHLKDTKDTKDTEDTEDTKDTEKVQYRCTITDEGMGFSYQDLKYLMQTGSSNDNLQKQTIINTMPEWLRPSGNFGIGFQSVFMWTNQVEIKTRSYLTNECLKIVLHKPDSEKEGLIEIDSIHNNPEQKIGTTLSFDFEVNRLEYIKNDLFGISNNFLKDHDYLLNTEFHGEVILIKNKIIEFSKNSPIKIIHESLLPIITKTEENKFDSDWQYFESKTDPVYQCRFKAKIKMSQSNKYNIFNKSIILFRGQEVEYFQKVEDFQELLTINYAAYAIDLLDKTASDYLSFNRNYLKPSAIDNVNKIIESVFTQWVKSNNFEEKELRLLSQISNIWSRKKHLDDKDQLSWKENVSKFNNKWLKLTCDTLYKKYNTSTNDIYHMLEYDFETFFNKIEDIKKLLIIFGGKKPSHIINTNKSDNHKIIKSSHTYIYEIHIAHSQKKLLLTIIDYLINKHKEYNLFIKYETIDDSVINYSFNKLNMNTETYNITSKENIIIAINECIVSKLFYGINRFYIPAIVFESFIKDIQKIILKKTLNLSAINPLLGYYPSDENIILPYEFNAGTITLNRFDDFIQWVSNNLETPSNLEEIRDIYIELMNHINETLMTDSETWQNAIKDIKDITISK